MTVPSSSRMLARSLLGGMAALALAATGAIAQPEGKGQGGGNGNGPNKGASTQQDKGPGKAPGNDKGNGKGGNSSSADRPGNGSPIVSNASHGNAADKRGNDIPPGQRNASGDNGPASSNGRVASGPKKGNGNGNAPQANRLQPRPAGNSGRNDKRFEQSRYGDGPVALIFARNDRMILDRGMLDGCPPGLAKKRNGCTPPGLDRRNQYRFDDSSWWRLPGLSDGRYRYYGGNLVRLSDAGSVLGYYPLLGGALSVGQAWPNWYDADPLPRYTQEYYSLGSNYRYADNVIYRTDPQTNAITSIAALLTGSDFQIGQPVPSGYDIYNVPYGYRDRYRDEPGARYRYSDGYVYQVDPTTQLIVAAIELLA